MKTELGMGAIKVIFSEKTSVLTLENIFFNNRLSMSLPCCASGK